MSQSHDFSRSAHDGSNLMRAFDFVDDDLEINKRGYLSEAQISRLKNAFVQWGTACVLSFALAAIALLLSRHSEFFGIMGLVLGGGAAYCAVPAWRYYGDLSDADIRVCSGDIALNIRRDKNGTHYIAMICDRDFSLRENQFMAFQNGERYVICYLPNSQMILSAARQD